MNKTVGGEKTTSCVLGSFWIRYLQVREEAIGIWEDIRTRDTKLEVISHPSQFDCQLDTA